MLANITILVSGERLIAGRRGSLVLGQLKFYHKAKWVGINYDTLVASGIEVIPVV